MVVCAVVKCSSRSSRKKKPVGHEPQVRLSFHKFPHDPEIRSAWIKAVRREDWAPNEKSFVCSKHFTLDCFDSSDFQRRLVKNAIPTMFPAIYNEPIPDIVKMKPVTLFEVGAANIKTESVENPPYISSIDVSTASNSEETNINENISARQIIARSISFSPNQTRHEAQSLARELYLIKSFKRQRSVYLKKIKALHQRSRRQVKCIDSLKTALNDLKQKSFVTCNCLANICEPNTDF